MERWSRYERTEGRLAGLGGGLGLIWQGDRFGGNGARTASAPDPLVLPAFMRVDAALTYRLSDRIDLGLNIDNLTDEAIFVSGTVGSSLEIAAPRTLMFRVGYRVR
jgi:outer membrane receptor protein involved in Fe transport